jgi:hypothetical protein
MSNDPARRLHTDDPEPTRSEPRVASEPRVPRPTPLRRWSVAELIARAVPRPPAGGVAH